MSCSLWACLYEATHRDPQQIAETTVGRLHPELSLPQRRSAAEAVVATLSRSELLRVKTFLGTDLGRRFLEGRPAMHRWVQDATAEQSVQTAFAQRLGTRLVGTLADKATYSVAVQALQRVAGDGMVSQQ